MADTSLCPPLWPQMLWGLNLHARGGPIKDYCPIIEELMASLHIHALSYLMTDEGAANQVRSVAKQRLMHAANGFNKSGNKRCDEASSVPYGICSNLRISEKPAVSKMHTPMHEGLDHAAVGKMRALVRAARSTPKSTNPAFTDFQVSLTTPGTPDIELATRTDQAAVSKMRALVHDARRKPQYLKT
jgi:hypothetical protein